MRWSRQSRRWNLACGSAIIYGGVLISNDTYYFDGNFTPPKSPTSTRSKIHLRGSSAAEEILNIIVLRVVMHVNNTSTTRNQDGGFDALFGGTERVPVITTRFTSAGSTAHTSIRSGSSRFSIFQALLEAASRGGP